MPVLAKLYLPSSKRVHVFPFLFVVSFRLRTKQPLFQVLLSPSASVACSITTIPTGTSTVDLHCLSGSPAISFARTLRCQDLHSKVASESSVTIALQPVPRRQFQGQFIHSLSVRTTIQGDNNTCELCRGMAHLLKMCDHCDLFLPNDWWLRLPARP